MNRLSPTQRLTWQCNAGPAAVSCSVRMRTQHDPARLWRALERVVARHDILRSRFVHDARLRFPQREVLAEAPLVKRERDLRALPPQAADAEVERAFHEAARGELAADAQALAVLLMPRADATLDAVIALPALCADAATLRLLCEAWSAELLLLLQGAASQEPPIDYAQYAEWQNELEAESRADTVDAPKLALPFERSAPPRGARALRYASIAAPELRALSELARRCEVTLAALCQAVFVAQLGALSEAPRIGLALECSGRDFEDVRELLGPIARFQPIAAEVPLQLDLAALRAAQHAIDAAEVEDTPLGEAAADQLDALLGFAFRDLTLPRGPFVLERVAVAAAGPRHVLGVHALGDKLALTLSYDEARMGEQAAEVLLAQYTHALQQLAAATSLPVRVCLPAPAPHPSLAASEAEPLTRAFERHAARDPNRVAVVCADAALSHAQLERRSNQLAHRLRALGVSGTPIGLWAERTTSTLVGLLAILKAGAAYVPLDPEAPPERLRAQVRAGGLTRLVARTTSLATAGIEGLRVIAQDDATLEQEPAAPPPWAAAPDELASLIFTSGSTGAPKAVAITQQNIASYTRSILGLLAPDVPLHFATVSTLSADLGNTSIFAALASGGCLHIIDYATATDGAAFAAYHQRSPIDVLKIVPSHLSALLDAGHGASVLPRRVLITGGEALSPALRARVRALAPTCRLINHYGPTETTVGALALDVNTLQDDRGCASIPIGVPLAHADALVLDDTLAPSAIGVPGELYLGGAGLARGYFGRPDLTAERFVPHPFRAGARLYRTGDRARLRPDGSVEFLGRRDHQLKIRGFRVELGEIESRLMACPEVSAAVVVAKPSPAGGHTLSGYVVPRGDKLDEAALRAFLGAALPDYMIPTELIAQTTLPRTSNGKIDRVALSARARERQLRAYREPETDVERALAAIWRELLQLPRVGVDDDFFALGGHSLLAIPMLHRIREAVGGGLSLGALFEARTIAKLAQKLAATGPTGLTVLREQGTGAPLFCFDPTGMHAHVYEPLVSRVACPVVVVDFPMQASADGELALETLAQEYAARLRALQPSGPYRLVGWSLGGVLALATARALERAAERVSFLGIVDTHARAELYAHSELEPWRELAAYLSDDQADALAALPASEHSALARAVAGKHGRERVTAAVTWAQHTQLLPDDASAEQYYTRYRLLRAAAGFVAQLTAADLCADVHAFWATRSLTRTDRTPTWAHLTKGRERAQIITGDHDELLQRDELLDSIASALSADAARST